MKFKIFLERNRIFSNSQKATSLAASKKLGEVKHGIVIYSPYEALYILDLKLAEIFQKDKKISIKKFLDSQNKDILRNYLVYKELRKKGFIVKTGAKFGAEFRVYKKGERHARWLVHITSDRAKTNFKDLISKTRISHSSAKKLLIAVIDSQEDTTYLEIDWTKL